MTAGRIRTGADEIFASVIIPACADLWSSYRSTKER
jgi:hypothetical protein